MKRILRRNTEIVSTELYSINTITGDGPPVTMAYARTNNGVGLIAFTIKSKLEPKHDPTLAHMVLKGRLNKALNQYRKGGQVRTKLAVLIPAKSM